MDDEEISQQEEEEIEDKHLSKRMKLVAASLAQLAEQERGQKVEDEVGFRGGCCKAMIYKFCESRRPYMPPKSLDFDSYRPFSYPGDYRGDPIRLKFTFEQELPH